MPEKPDSPANRTSEPADDFGAHGSLERHGAAVEELLRSRKEAEPPEPEKDAAPSGCPSAGMQSFQPLTPCQSANKPIGLLNAAPAGASALSHWPIQIRLVPPTAPFLKNADLLVAADCTPIAYPAFHLDFLQGRVVMTGCPKFDDVDGYLNRLPNKRIEAIVNDGTYFKLISLDSYTLEAQLLLEELALVRSERRLLAEGSRYFQSIDLDRSANEIRLQLDEQQWKIYDEFFLRPIRMMTQPIARLDGIPEEFSDVPVIMPASNNKPLIDRDQLTALLVKINPENEDQWHRVIAASLVVDHTIENILLLKELRNEEG